MRDIFATARRKKPTILLVGGGTGGHILPLLPLADELKSLGATVEILLGDSELDRRIAEMNFSGFSTNFCRTEKIRRYFSVKNFLAPFQIFAAVWRAGRILRKIRPDAIFFKGGFVGFPILLAARIFQRKSLIFSHESDISPGILSCLAAKFSVAKFSNFEDGGRLFFSEKIAHSPPPRRDFLKILIFGGSQGAEFLNEIASKNLERICKKFRLEIITGVGKKIGEKRENFEEIEFCDASKLAKKIRESDLIVSRAGSNSIFEILAARKKSILVPLPSVARNHQFLNAKFFADRGMCEILEQNREASRKFLNLIERTIANKKMDEKIAKSAVKNDADRIARVIFEKTSSKILKSD